VFVLRCGCGGERPPVNRGIWVSDCAGWVGGVGVGVGVGVRRGNNVRVCMAVQLLATCL